MAKKFLERLVRRTDKSQTIEQYREQRESKRIKKKETVINIHRDISRRHKFKSTKEQVKEMEMSISCKMEEIKLYPSNYNQDLIGCFFSEELETQREQQDSPLFRILYNDIVDLVQSLPLILINLPKIVNHLITALSHKAITKEVLLLLIPLFRDCKQELYYLFCTSIMPALVNILAQRPSIHHPLDLDSVQQVFHVLAYALRYFFNSIVTQFSIFLQLYRDTLFNTKVKLLVQFSVESFSYILRKADNKQSVALYTEIMSSLQEPVDLYAQLVLESLKAFKTSLSHKKDHVIPIILNYYLQNNQKQPLLFPFVQSIISHAQQIYAKQGNQALSHLYQVILDTLIKQPVSSFEPSQIIQLLETMNLSTRITQENISTVFLLIKHMQCYDNPNLYKFLGNLLRNNHKLVADYSIFIELVNCSLSQNHKLAFLQGLINVKKNEYDDQIDFYKKKYCLNDNQYNIVINMIDTKGLLQFTNQSSENYLEVCMLLVLIHRYSNKENTKICLDLNQFKDLSLNENIFVNLNQNFYSTYIFLQMVKVYTTNNDSFNKQILSKIQQLNVYINKLIVEQFSQKQSSQKQQTIQEYQLYEVDNELVQKYEQSINMSEERYKITQIKNQILTFLISNKVQIDVKQELQCLNYKELAQDCQYLNSIYILIQQNDNISQNFNMQVIIDGLRSKVQQKRQNCLQILLAFNQNDNQVIFKQLDQINSLKINLENEKTIILYLEKLNLLLLSHIRSKNTEEEKQLQESMKIELHLESIINFMVGYSCSRLTTIYVHIQNIFSTILDCCSGDKSIYRVQVLNFIKYYNYILSIDYQGQEKIEEEEENMMMLIKECNFVEDDSCEEQSAFDNLMIGLQKAKHFAKDNQTLLVQMVGEFYQNEWHVFRKDGKKKEGKINEHQEKVTDLQIDTVFVEETRNIDTLIQLKEKSEKRETDKESLNLVTSKCAVFTKLLQSIKNLTKTQSPLIELVSSTVLELLREGQERLQKSAIDCLPSLGIPGLEPYQKSFIKMINKDTFKSEMLQFDPSSIPSKDRPEVVQVLLSVLFSKLFNTKGIKGSSHLTINKKQVLSFFSCLQPNEIHSLYHLICIYHNITNCAFSPFSLSSNTINGYLRTIIVLIQQAGQLLLEILTHITKTLLNLAHHMTILKHSSISTHYTQRHKETNKTLIQCISLIYETYPTYDSLSLFTHHFLTIHQHSLNHLSTTVTSITNLLKLFQAWAHSPLFHHYFLTYPQILTNILQMYTNPKLHKVVFDLINNMVIDILDTKDKDNSLSYKSIGKLICSQLLINLQIYMKQSSSLKNKMKKRPELGLIRVLCLASEYVNTDNTTEAQSLIDLLCPMIEWKVLDKMLKKRQENIVNRQRQEEYLFKTFTILLRLSSFANINQSLLETLLVNVRVLPLRNLIIQILQKSITKEASDFLTNTNTYQKLVDKMIDYDHVLPIFYTLNTIDLPNLSQDSLKIIMLQCVYLLEDPEMSLRSAIMTTFSSIFSLITSNPSIYPSLLSFLSNTFLRLLTNLLQKAPFKKHEYIIKSVSSLFFQLIHTLTTLQPISTPYSDLLPLQQFFNPLFEIQLSLRLKALNYFLKTFASLTISDTSINNVILPLLNYLIMVKCDEMSNTRTAITDKTLSNFKTLLELSLDALCMAIKQLPWSSYSKILKKVMQKLDTKMPDHQHKIVIKYICALLQQMPLKDNLDTFLNKLTESNQNEENTNDYQQGVEHYQQHHLNKQQPQDQQQQIYKFLRLRVLVPLKKHLLENVSDGNQNDGRKVRVFLVVAVLHLIKRLPWEIFTLEFNKLLGTVCSQLKSKQYEIRESSRKALLKVTHMLGHQFLGQVLRELKTYLIKGFQLHVMNYTIWALLHDLLSKGGQESALNGQLDYLIIDICQLLFNEILGHIEEEKEVQSLAKKGVETKKNKAQESLFLLAKVVSFDNVQMLLKSIRKEIETKKLESKVLIRYEESLRSILKGLAKNSSIAIEPLLHLSHQLIDQALVHMQIKSDKPEFFESSISDNKQQSVKRHNLKSKYEIQECADNNTSIIKRTKQKAMEDNFQYGRLFADFGLKLLLLASQDNLMNDLDQNLSVILDSNIQLIVDCLSATNNQIVASALKLLNSLLAREKTRLHNHQKRIVDQLLIILQDLSEEDLQLCKESFRLLEQVLKQKEEELSEDQTTGILLVIERFMLISDSMKEPLECLNALIHLHIVRPQVYNMMEKVVENMVTSHSVQMQAVCKVTFLDFLMVYPMTTQSIQYFIHFLIKNLNYHDSSGRLLVVQAIRLIIQKFDINILDHYSVILYYALIVQYVNELDTQARTQLALSLKELLHKTNHNNHQILYEKSLEWFQSNQITLQETGLQSLCFFQLKNNPKIIVLIKDVLVNAKQEMEEVKEVMGRQKEQQMIKTIDNKVSAKQQLGWAQFFEENDEVRDLMQHDRLLAFAIEIIQKQLQNGQKWLLSNDILQLIVDVLQYPNQQVLDNILQLFTLFLQMNRFQEVVSLFTDQQFLDQLGKRLLYFLTVSMEQEVADKLQNLLLLIFDFIHTNKGDESFLFMLKYITKMLRKQMSKIQKSIRVVKRVLDLLNQMSNLKEGALIAGKEDIVIEILNILQNVRGGQEFFQANDADIITQIDLTTEAIKQVVDHNLFYKLLTQVNSAIMQHKNKRKLLLKTQLVTDPVKAALMKRKKNIQKKEQEKRKIKKLKGLYTETDGVNQFDF